MTERPLTMSGQINRGDKKRVRQKESTPPPPSPPQIEAVHFNAKFIA